MNIPDLIIVSTIIVLFAIVIVSLIRTRKHGKCHGCGKCPGGTKYNNIPK